MMKIKLWLGEMSPRSLNEIPQNILQMIGISPFRESDESDKTEDYGWLNIEIKNEIAVFSKISGKWQVPVFKDFTKSNGHNITDISMADYGSSHRDQTLLLGLIFNLKNVKRFDLWNYLNSDMPLPKVSLNKPVLLPSLVEFKYSAAESPEAIPICKEILQLLNHVLCQSRNLETISIDSQVMYLLHKILRT